MAMQIKEVARLAKVSVATISRVINNSPKVTPQTRERVLKVIKEVDYHPNISGLRLRTKKAFAIGVVSQHFGAFFHQYLYHVFGETIRGVALGVRETRYDIVMARPSLDWDENTDYLRLYKQGKVDGLVNIYPTTNDLNLPEIREKNIPLVQVGSASEDLDFVEVDNRACVKKMVDHLVDCGYKRIGILNGRLNEVCYHERFAAFKETLTANGLALIPELAIHNIIGSDDAEPRMQELLAHKPDAVFTTNDLFAEGAAQAINRAGLSIPGDIALAGYTDTPQALSIAPGLTTVRVPLADMGAKAAELLINRIENQEIPQQRVVLPGELIVRGSTNKQKEISH